MAAAAEGRRGSKEADGSAAADQLSPASSLSRNATVSDSSKEGGKATAMLLLEWSAPMRVDGGRRAWSCAVGLRLTEPAQRSAPATATVTALIDPRCRSLWKHSDVRSSLTLTLSPSCLCTQSSLIPSSNHRQRHCPRPPLCPPPALDLSPRSPCVCWSPRSRLCCSSPPSTP